ncbi:hypothetical protein [Nocardioides panacisoli]|uniref:Uncharacterized protein n=1 Tax=Nocardioides panacisoli TaxID=627624 RepID=A0ABP7J313_9ACTN
MFSKLKGRMTYANVASTAALLIAIGGSGAAVAATLVPHNSVGSAQIINGSVKGRDIHPNAVGSIQAKDNALTGTDVADDSLTGSDVDENSLGQVPNANNANNANTATTANGLSSGAINSPSVFGTANLGIVRGYAWNNSASANADITNNGYTYNRSGGAVNVVHNSAGNYSITFTGLNLGGGNIVVSGYGGGAVWCKVGGWSSSTITVLCYNSAGTATDSDWTLAATD